MKSAKTRASDRKRMKTPRTSALLIRLAPDALQAMRESASHLDLSMSAMVSRSGAEYLKRRVLATTGEPMR